MSFKELSGKRYDFTINTYTDFKSVDSFYTIYMISFIFNEILYNFNNAIMWPIGMYINYMMLSDDIRILYVDKMS